MSPGGPDAQDPSPGLPPRYEVRNFLGKGAMGRVYLCRDTELDVVVAVKVLAPHLAADPSAIEQVKTEARAVAKFRGCPSILSLYGFEQFEGAWYLVMEYAAGGSLDEKLKREGRFPEKECRRIGAEVAEALAFAHRHRVLHRDIKPANILLDATGRAKVADFGIAKVLHGEQESTSTLSMAGTPVYMPPEAILRGPLDARSDIYSLGCMLYEMASGKRPYAGTPVEIFMLKAGEESRLPDVRDLVPEVSTDYSAIVRRAAAPSPGERFPDGASLAAALRAGAAEAPGPSATITTRPPAVDDGATLKNIPEPPRAAAAPTPPPPPPSAPKSKAPLVAAAAVVLAAGAAWAIFGGGGEKPAPSAPKPPAPEVKNPPDKKPDPKPVNPKTEIPKPDDPKAETPKQENPAPTNPDPAPPPPTPKAFVFAVKGLPKPLKPLHAGRTLPSGFEVKEDGRIACLKDRSEMVYVEAGPFSMGNGGGDADEKPVHEVSLKEFLIDRHEVTVSMYRTFCTENGRNLPLQPGPEDGPVVGITWDDASAYAAWAGKRLPTEAQWERAARGTDARDYPWGGDADPFACNRIDRGDGYENMTSPGTFPKDRSPADCFDMGGNACEWCRDWYQADWYSKGGGIEGPAEGQKRVVRGGAANLELPAARTWRRSYAPPDIVRAESRIGFRCVADVEK